MDGLQALIIRGGGGFTQKCAHFLSLLLQGILCTPSESLNTVPYISSEHFARKFWWMESSLYAQLQLMCIFTGRIGDQPGNHEIFLTQDIW